MIILVVDTYPWSSGSGEDKKGQSNIFVKNIHFHFFHFYF